VPAAGLLLAAGCAVLLVAKAQDGVHAIDALSSSASVQQAGAQNAYYNCLSDQAHKLVPTNESVALSTDAETAQGSALFGAIVSWARIVPDAQDASIVLGLVAGHGPGSCGGSVVVATAGRAASAAH
jgi:hypothetical protein